MTGLIVVLFLILVPLSGLVMYTRSSSPRTVPNTPAPRPQPRTARPVASQRPVAVAAPPEPAPRRRRSRRTYMLRQHRKIQRIRAAHSLELELLRARVAVLEAALLERLVLAEF